MAKVLVIKKADFSANGIPSSGIFAKEYATISQDTQFVELAAISSFDYTDVKLEFIAQVVEFGTIDRYRCIQTSQFEYMNCVVNKDGKLEIKIAGETVMLENVSLSDDFSFGYDTKNKTAFFNGVQKSFNVDIASGNRTSLKLFSNGTSTLDKAGVVKIKYLKWTIPSTGRIVAELTPVKFNGVGYLYNKVTKELIGANTGTLSVE